MKIKKKLKKYPNGGREPIVGTPQQYQAYQDSLDLYNFYQLQKDLDRASDINTNLSFTERLFGGQRQFLPEGERRQTELFNKAQDLLIRNPNLKTGLDSFPTSTKEDYRKKGSYDIYHPKIKPKGEWMGSGKNSEYVKPVQPIIYQPTVSTTVGDVTGDKIAKSKNNVAVLNSKLVLKDRPKEQFQELNTKIQYLPQKEQHLEFDPIGLKKGTYFTRPRQQQEQSSQQFGREKLVDYFDNKTGKLLKTMENGGSLNKYPNGGRPQFE